MIALPEKWNEWRSSWPEPQLGSKTSFGLIKTWPNLCIMQSNFSLKLEKASEVYIKCFGKVLKGSYFQKGNQDQFIDWTRLWQVK